MGKGKKSLLDIFKVSDDEDEYDEESDDLFDEDDEDEEDEGFSFRRRKKDTAAVPPSNPAPRPQYSNPAPAPRPASSYQPGQSTGYSAARSTASTAGAVRKRGRQDDNLVSFEGQRSRNLKPNSEVYVIKPQEFDDAQTVSDLLKNGKTIVINMEGVEIDPAQRIIDFIGGACYGLGGDLRAISASIFIAAPNNIEVSGDLRDEILNDSTLSPQLGK